MYPRKPFERVYGPCSPVPLDAEPISCKFLSARVNVVPPNWTPSTNLSGDAPEFSKYFTVSSYIWTSGLKLVLRINYHVLHPIVYSYRTSESAQFIKLTCFCSIFIVLKKRKNPKNNLTWKKLETNLIKLTYNTETKYRFSHIAVKWHPERGIVVNFYETKKWSHTPLNS